MLTSEEAQVALTIYKLLRNATSQEIVKDFLRSKQIPVSASNWDDLYTRRIDPALQEGVISVADLRTLLRDVEECGRQHTFLYRCTPDHALALLGSARLRAVLTDAGLLGLLSDPLDLELPESPTIVDIREIPADQYSGFPSLLIKVVETRTKKVFLHDLLDKEKKTFSKIYSYEEKRAVNIVRLYADGLLELRIASQDNSTQYHDNVNALFGIVSKIIPPGSFTEVLLGAAKNRLFNDRKNLVNEVRYSNSTARNDFGYSMNLSCSSQDDNICDDSGSTAALESFIEQDGQIIGTNIYLKINGTNPAREVHVLISGASHEFAVPASCSMGDYEYVRRQIFDLNH